MEKFRRFLHPVWTGFVLLIAAYVLRGVFLCARDTFLYNRLDLCDPADFKIYHRNMCIVKMFGGQAERRAS